MAIGTLAVRGVIGPLFIGHGTQKLFGWFGGHGPDGTGAFFEGLGLRPGKRHALAAGGAETAGGVLLTAGALTPLAATLVTGTMTTAIRKVHAPKGPWVTEGGWEYNAVLIAAVAAVAEHGPGRPSVDARFFPRLKGARWAALAVAAGVVGSYLGTAPPLNEPAPSEEGPAGDAAQADERFDKAGAATATAA